MQKRTKWMIAGGVFLMFGVLGREPHHAATVSDDSLKEDARSAVTARLHYWGLQGTPSYGRVYVTRQNADKVDVCGQVYIFDMGLSTQSLDERFKGETFVHEMGKSAVNYLATRENGEFAIVAFENPDNVSLANYCHVAPT